MKVPKKRMSELIQTCCIGISLHMSIPKTKHFNFGATTTVHSWIEGKYFLTNTYCVLLSFCNSGVYSIWIQMGWFMFYYVHIVATYSGYGHFLLLKFYPPSTTKTTIISPKMGLDKRKVVLRLWVKPSVECEVHNGILTNLEGTLTQWGIRNSC